MSLIQLVGISRFYEEGAVNALDGIDLEIGPGEFVAVTGRSGSGKTTLLNLLGLLDRPTAGTYRWRGTPTEDMSERRRNRLRARSVGFVFQDSHLIPTRTVSENLELALRLAGVPRRVRRARAVAALERVGLGHRIDARPSTLSGGERQRAALARGLVHEPELLLCDEPTGNLDTSNAQRVLELLREAPPGGCAVILVTHDPGLAEQADRRIELSDGRVVADTRRLPSDGAARSDETPTGRRGRVLDFIDDVGLNVSRRPFRAFVSAFGTILAVGMFVYSVAMATTTSSRIEQVFDLLAATEVRLGAPPAFTAVREPAVEERVGRIPGVVDVGRTWEVEEKPMAAGEGPWAAPSRMVAVRAVSPGAVAFLKPDVDGDGFVEGDHAFGVPAALVGSVVAADAPVPIVPGSIIRLGGREFMVRGIVEDVQRNPDVLFQVLVPATTAERLWPDEGSAWELVVEVEVGTAETVAGLLPLAADPEQGDRLVAQTLPEAKNLRQTVTTQVDEFVVLLAGGLLVASVFGIASATMAGVLERRFEIGLRRALGMSRRSIAAMFLAETTLTGVLASLLGLVAALAIFLVVAGGRGWAPVIPLEVIVAAPIAGLGTGLVAGIVPAVHASRLEPVEALRR